MKHNQAGSYDFKGLLVKMPKLGLSLVF